MESQLPLHKLLAQFAYQHMYWHKMYVSQQINDTTLIKSALETNQLMEQHEADMLRE